jgi:hypothetical protein
VLCASRQLSSVRPLTTDTVTAKLRLDYRLHGVQVTNDLSHVL